MDNEQGGQTHWRHEAAARHEDAAESETVSEGMQSRRSAACSKLAAQIKEAIFPGRLCTQGPMAVS
jgi:hypothetical protein